MAARGSYRNSTTPATRGPRMKPTRYLRSARAWTLAARRPAVLIKPGCGDPP